MKKETITKTNTEPVIYCGPDIRHVMRQFAVYDGSPPAYVQELIREDPNIARLLVPVTKLAETRAAISMHGTPENIWYNKILKRSAE